MLYEAKRALSLCQHRVNTVVKETDARGVYLRNMAESMNQKGMIIVKESHTPIAAPVIDPGRDGKMVFPFPLSRLPQTILYLITRVSMQYRELLHECNKMFIIHTIVASCLIPPSNSPFKCIDSN